MRGARQLGREESEDVIDDAACERFARLECRVESDAARKTDDRGLMAEVLIHVSEQLVFSQRPDERILAASARNGKNDDEVRTHGLRRDAPAKIFLVRITDVDVQYGDLTFLGDEELQL